MVDSTSAFGGFFIAFSDAVFIFNAMGAGLLRIINQVLTAGAFGPWETGLGTI